MLPGEDDLDMTTTNPPPPPPPPHHHLKALTDPRLRLPLDVLRLIFEESLRIHSPSAHGGAARQAAGYTLALVSRTTAAWTAPLLYARVVLVRPAQAAAFARTLRAGVAKGGKGGKGLAGCVRVLWVLVDQGRGKNQDAENLRTELNEVIRICSNLTSLVCLGHASLILLPVAPTAPSSLHTLTLIAPTPAAAHALPHLHLHTLRIIDASAAFYHAWNDALYASLSLSLSASASGLSISEIDLEMLFVPSTTLLLWLDTGTLPGLALCPHVARVRVHARWVFPADCPPHWVDVDGDGGGGGERREEYCTPDNWSRCFVFYTSSAKSIVRSSIAQPSQAELVRIRGTSAVEAAIEIVAQHDYE